MNERIKKLKIQATSYTWNGNDVTEELDEEKFAQLIVKECDRYVAEQYDEYEPWMQPGDLLKHFGVGL
jgi:hypothetical protein